MLTERETEPKNIMGGSFMNGGNCLCNLLDDQNIVWLILIGLVLWCCCCNGR